MKVLVKGADLLDAKTDLRDAEGANPCAIEIQHANKTVNNAKKFMINPFGVCF